MVYNRTKRGLEKATGIIGVVVSSMEIFSSIIMMAMALGYFYYIDALMFSISIIMLFFSIINLIFCALIIKSPIDENGKVKDRKGIQICVIVFSFFAGNFVVLGLEIAVICLKDLVSAKNQQQIEVQSIKLDSIEAKINEIKRLKELGIVDDDTYKKALEKIINDLK